MTKLVIVFKLKFKLICKIILKTSKMATKLRILGGLIIVMLGTNMLHAQVGINTTDPKAQLEIKSSNPATPSNKDGILIPKINAFPTTNPSVDQDGMMVFLTTTVGANPKGFYYWDNAATSWKIVSGKSGWNDNGNADTTPGTNFIGTIDNKDLVIKTNNADAMTIKADGKVGIGTNNPNGKFQFANDLTNRKIVLFESNNNDENFYGFGINAATLRYNVDFSTSNHVFYAANNELMRLTGTGKLGIGTATPDPSAQLDVTSTTGGVLLPRMTTAQRDAIANPKEGLLIFNSTSRKFQGYAVNDTESLANLAGCGSIKNGVINGGPSGCFGSQAFTSTLTGLLKSITVYVGGAGPLTFNFYSGDFNTGTVLYTTTLSPAGAAGNTIIFPSPININKDQLLSFSVQAPLGITLSMVSCTAAVQGGITYFFNGYQTGYSFKFKTLVDVPPSGWVDLNLNQDSALIADNWQITGNANTDSNSFLGTTDSKDLVIKTNNTNAMIVKADGKIGIGTTSPDVSAELDISSTNGGVLLPRMTTAQRDAIVDPKSGLVVYNTSTSKYQGYIGPELDISQPTNSPGGGLVAPCGQSFKVGKTGFLKIIKINVTFTGYFCTLKLFNGSGISGTPIYSQTYIGTNNAINTILITGSVPVTVGQIMSFSVDSQCRSNTSNPYPDGIAYTFITSHPDKDLYFETFVQETTWIDLSRSLEQISTISNISNWGLYGNANIDTNSSFLGTLDNKDFITKTNSIERTRITSSGNIGIGTPTPDGLLDIESTTNNALFIKAPNSQIRLQESDNNNKQWKFEVNNGDFAVTENAVAVPFKILDNSANNALVLNNNVVEVSKTEIGGGSTINKTQHGTMTVGSGTVNSITRSVTLTFPTAFSGVPNVVATALNDSNFGDKFSITTTSISATSVTFIVFRLDATAPTNGSPGWGQNLKLSWWAFE